MGPIGSHDRVGEKAKQLSDDNLHWVANGEIVNSLDQLGLEAWDEASLLDRKGLVRLKTDEKGTTVRWSVFAGNWSSLYFVMDWLLHQPRPITLQYYLVGWFIETLDDAVTARGRIHAIMAKSDLHLQSRTFVRSVNPKESTYIPDILGDALTHSPVSPDYSIDCMFDPEDERFKVKRIGTHTPIARLWGVTPVSYPCINGGSYDQIVSEIYHKVIQTGQPHYDHVYAAMTSKASAVRWIPYQRVILPQQFSDGQKGVRVVSEICPVDIKVV